MSEITYRVGNDLTPDELIDLFRATSLGVRRPLEDHHSISSMIKHGNLTVTAWDDSRLVGIARSMTDFSYVAYLSDLAVRDSHQHRGIGRELIRLTRSNLGPTATIVLLAAPAATDYYPQLGFTQHCSAWTLAGNAPLLGGE